jgi:hypothetical protein
VRLSATDWAEGPEKDADGKWLQWGIEQTVLLTGELKKLGVDLVDVSSGGNWVAQKIPVVPGYQVRAVSLSLPPSLRKTGQRDAEPGVARARMRAHLNFYRFRLQRRSRRRTLTLSWARWA